MLKGGPWFVRGHYLSIRNWEPNFKPSSASVSSVVVWVLLPELHIEYYEPTVLQDIGQAIGLVLHIDTHTASESRGCFARLCIKVNFNKPLIKLVKVGGVTQLVQYEGISSLCFSCGTLDHKVDCCPYTNRALEKVGEENLEGKISGWEDQNSSETDNFGLGILVEKKKHTNRRVNSTPAQIAILRRRSPMANTANPLSTPSLQDLDLPGFEKSEGKRKMGSSCTMSRSNMGQKENSKSIVKPNLTKVTKVSKGPPRGQKSNILSPGPSKSKGSRQTPILAGKHFQPKKPVETAFTEPMKACFSTMMTSPTDFKGFTVGVSTEDRSAIVVDQVMSDHKEKSSEKCTLGIEGGFHWTGTVKPPLRDISNMVVVASVNISKATLLRIELVIKSSQEAFSMEANLCNLPIDGSNM